MGQAKIKALKKPDISVLIPVRGRKEKTEQCVRSLIEKAGSGAKYEILLAIDDDDTEVEGIVLPPECRVFIWERPPTLGDKLNRLAGEAKSEIFWFIANDYEMETEGWTDIFLDAVAALPNGIGVPYPHDDEHPDHSAFPIITKKMAMAIGFFMAPWFPYWFIDTWWDETGILTDLKMEIPVTVKLQGGREKSHSLVDLAFWASFFEETRPMRARDAIGLLGLAYGGQSEQVKQAMSKLDGRINFCAQRVAHLRHPSFVKGWEAQSASPPSSAYDGVKYRAEELLAKVRQNRPRRLKVCLCIPSGRQWEAGTATDVCGVVTQSSLAGIDMMLLNVQTSMISMARNTIVEKALDQGADYLLWIDSDQRVPADTLLRLLAHEKDIVGATYNKRVHPYDTLGKLKGDKPQKVSGGLHEAVYLPGGVLLVKAEVYKKIGFPFYFETYQWPATNKLTAFKQLLSDYFRDVPPQEVLDSIDDSDLGDWIAQNYRLGENDERLQYTSEDVNFCRKARKAGFKIWCDLDLTYQVKHIGVLEVPCKDPETLTDEERQQLFAAGFAAAAE